MSTQNKHLESFFNEGYAFSDLLPYMEYTDDIFLLSDGSLGRIWKVSTLPIEGKSMEDLSALVNQWENLFMRVPNEHMAFQIILSAQRNDPERIDKYTKYTEHDAGTSSVADHVRPAGCFTHKAQNFSSRNFCLYLTARYFPDWQKIWKKDLDDQAQQLRAVFLRHIASIESALLAAGVIYEVMNGEEFVGWLYRLLNPKRSAIISQAPYSDEDPLREQILFHTPQSTGCGFIFEGTRTRVISLKEVPVSTMTGMFTREFYEGNKFCLVDTVPEFFLVVNFTLPATATARNRLNMQKAFAFMHQENWLGDKSVEAVEKKKELDETMTHMFQSGSKIVQARLHWIIQGATDNDVEDACNHLLSGLNRLHCEGLKEDLIGASLFLTCLPLNFDPYYERFIRRSRRLLSGNAADMLPVFGSFQGTKTPAHMYCNRRGELVFLDLFDSNINPHAVLVGASGSGKSFFINDLVIQSARLGSHFFVLDKGDSYKKLCAILNGQYSAFDFNNPVTINPFINPPTSENLSFLLSLLSHMASGGDERYRLNREEEGLLQKAVVRAYELKRIDAEVTLSNVVGILNDNQFNEQCGINSLMGPMLALRLSSFTSKGPYGSFFDGPNQLTVEKRFIVFELASLSSFPDLQVAVLLNLMFFMTNFVSAKQMKARRKYLLIDEAWSLLKVKNTADFISNAFKTFRKYRCSVVAITQEMADLTRQESGIAILANAANKIFLKQEPGVIDLLKDKLALKEEVIKALKTIETVKGKFSEAFVMTDSCSGVIRLVPSPFLYWVANSEPRNNEYLANQTEYCQGNLMEAIKKCAQEHPYGL